MLPNLFSVINNNKQLIICPVKCNWFIWYWEPFTGCGENTVHSKTINTTLTWITHTVNLGSADLCFSSCSGGILCLHSHLDYNAETREYRSILRIYGSDLPAEPRRICSYWQLVHFNSNGFYFRWGTEGGREREREREREILLSNYLHWTTSLWLEIEWNVKVLTLWPRGLAKCDTRKENIFE